MVTLELTDDEATRLMLFLGIHSVRSSVDTYPIYEKLSHLVDPDNARADLSPAAFTELLMRVTQTDAGLIEIGPGEDDK